MRLPGFYCLVFIDKWIWLDPKGHTQQAEKIIKVLFYSTLRIEFDHFAVGTMYVTNVLVLQIITVTQPIPTRSYDIFLSQYLLSGFRS